MTEILRKLSSEETDELVAVILSELSGGGNKAKARGQRLLVSDDLTWGGGRYVSGGPARGVRGNASGNPARDAGRYSSGDLGFEECGNSTADPAFAEWYDALTDLASVSRTDDSAEPVSIEWSEISREPARSVGRDTPDFSDLAGLRGVTEDLVSGDAKVSSIRKLFSVLRAGEARIAAGEKQRIRKEKEERLIGLINGAVSAGGKTEIGEGERGRTSLLRDERDSDLSSRRIERGEDVITSAARKDTAPLYADVSASARGAFSLSSRNEDRPRGAAMAEVSDFFRRDSRRYDSGFDLY